MMNYDEHREDYIKQHPASVPIQQVIRPKYPRWLKISVAAMFICAALVSGVHTIPTVRSGIEVNEIITPGIRDMVSVGSFIAVEFAILISAYIRAVNRWLSVGSLLVAFTVAVVSNVTSVQRALIDAESGAVTVALVLGVGAPLLAMLAGAVFLIIDTETKREAQDAEQVYRQALIDFDAKINAAWQKEQMEISLGVHEDFTNVREKDTSPNFTKPRVKIHEIAHLIHENGDASLSAADMMAKYQISAGSTSKVREILKSQNGNGNGEV